MSDAAQPTAADVRAAAEAVKTALDRHLEAVERRVASLAPAPAASGAGEGGRGAGERAAELDAAVYAAFDELAAAGETYDELLYELYDEVTPFEIPGSDSLPAYAGPEVPSALSVLIRRDYTIAEPQRLLSQAERVTELDPESAEDNGVEGVTAGSSVHAALGVLFGEYEPDEIATRHKEFGLDEGDSTLWVCAADEPGEPGEWLAAPFEQADPQSVICRFDVSSVFDDDEELLPVDDDTDEVEDEADEDLDDEADQGDSEDEGADGAARGTEGGSGGVRGTRVR